MTLIKLPIHAPSKKEMISIATQDNIQTILKMGYHDTYRTDNLHLIGSMFCSKYRD